MTTLRALSVSGLLTMCGCSLAASMPKPTAYDAKPSDPPAKKYESCITLADTTKQLANRDSLLAWTTGFAAASAGAAGIAVSNDATGNWWETGRKYYFIGAAVPLGALTAYFFSLSSNDARASSAAHAALALDDPKEAYNLCQKARADWMESRVTTNAEAEAKLLKADQDARNRSGDGGAATGGGDAGL